MKRTDVVDVDAADYDNSILLPDLILPSQYFHPTNPYRGEHRLLMAVLIDAIHCYLGNNDYEHFSALRWFNSQRQQGDLFSYNRICEIFSINSVELLRRIEGFRDRKIRRPYRSDII